MHHRLPHAPTSTPLCATVRMLCAGACALVAKQSAHRLVPRDRGGGVGLTPIKHASVAWRRVVARSHSARRLPPPEHVCLSQSKRWRGGTRPTAACACTVVCVCVSVRRRSWAGLWAVMERRTWHSLAVCVGSRSAATRFSPRASLKSRLLWTAGHLRAGLSLGV